MFIYYSDKNSKNRVSVVGTHENGLLKLGVARCGKKDNFCRKTGRTIAEGRLRKGNIFTKVPIDTCRTEDFIRHAKAVVDNVEKDPRVINSH